MEDVFFDVSEIKKELARDNISEAIKLLLLELNKVNKLSSFSKLFGDELIVFLASVNRLEKAYRVNVISWEQRSIERNKIIVSLLALLTELESKNSTFDEIKKWLNITGATPTYLILAKNTAKDKGFFNTKAIENLSDVISEVS